MEEIVYIRLGELPPGGRSRNYYTNELEVGVSVYEGVIRDCKALIILPSANDNAFDGTGSMFTRPSYVVTGEEIGRGSDGEPVLANVKIVRSVDLAGRKRSEHDCFAGYKPTQKHAVKTHGCVVGGNEYTIECTCGTKIVSPNQWDAQALFDFHFKRGTAK